MNSLTLKSPAKLNLYLKVLSRLPSGYHEILTLFHRISLTDGLSLRKIPQGFRLRCSEPRLSVGEDNLITRAYWLLQKKFPKLGGVSIFLRKRIPIGGGLGGGSSNAASFLLGMKRLYRLRISRKELAGMGARLGADVPFFLYEVNQAIGSHIGDKIRSRSSKVIHYFVLVLDAKGLSTSKVYQGFSRHLRPTSLTKVSRVATMLSDYLAQKNYAASGRLLTNDLERTVFQLRPSIRKIILKFHRLGIKAVRMSGSGPTVFALVSSLREAKKIARLMGRLEPQKKVLVCHSY